MPGELDKISQITIYLKDSPLEERVGEVALINPMARPLKDHRHHRWTHQKGLSPQARFFLGCRAFLLHHVKVLVSPSRKTAEALFKTAVANLLIHPHLQEFFLSTEEKKESFFKALQKGAEVAGYNFVPHPHQTIPEIIQELTTLPGHRKSLIDNPSQLRLQNAAQASQKRNEILHTILNAIPRPTTTSVLEIEALNSLFAVELATQHARWEVFSIDETTGRIDFQCTLDHVASAKSENGAANQKKVIELPSQQIVGSYCGQILSKKEIMAEILFQLQDEKITKASIHDSESFGIVEEKTFLFTSLYSWNAYEKILAEHSSFDALEGKVLQLTYQSGRTRSAKLHLLHQNLPFNLWNKFPTPAEVKGQLQDLNDEMMIQLLPRLWNFLGKPNHGEIEEWASQIVQSRSLPDFLAKQKGVLGAIDAFRRKKKEIQALVSAESHEVAAAFTALLEGKKGIDGLIFTGVVCRHLALMHNTHSEHGVERTAGACSADKAQRGFSQIRGKSFLPGVASEEEEALFKVLYTLYLVWEEPEPTMKPVISAKNPETSRYLTSWH